MPLPSTDHEDDINNIERIIRSELKRLVDDWNKYEKPYYDDKYISQAYKSYMKYYCNNNPYNLYISFKEGKTK